MRKVDETMKRSGMNYLKHISVLNYRNIASCELSFSQKINCFLGDNGMGKTNLLDAVYYLSFCKSHINAIDTQIVRHGEEFFMLNGVYEMDGHEEVITCSVKKRTKKQFRRNKKEYERLSDHIGFIPAVLISPSDIELISEGSDERRRFMDTVISQYDKLYLAALIRYNHALQQRNAMMKQEQEPDATMLDILEEQMAVEAEKVYACRLTFVERFTPKFQHYYEVISGGAEVVSLNYTSHCQQGSLVPLLKECRVRDRAVGYTTRGIHKDDLDMLLGDYPIKRTGSQGQNKSYLVALKLAQYEVLQSSTGKVPLLLLDGLFDKLDSNRVARIITLVASDAFGQIFMTDTNREHLDELVRQFGVESVIFEVINGEFKERV